MIISLFVFVLNFGAWASEPVYQDLSVLLLDDPQEQVGPFVAVGGSTSLGQTYYQTQGLSLIAIYAAQPWWGVGVQHRQYFSQQSFYAQKIEREFAAQGFELRQPMVQSSQSVFVNFRPLLGKFNFLGLSTLSCGVSVRTGVAQRNIQGFAPEYGWFTGLYVDLMKGRSVFSVGSAVETSTFSGNRAGVGTSSDFQIQWGLFL